jgi:Ran GTPase-activating protein (RanGAP) involved in mRNA processing and transport
MSSILEEAATTFDVSMDGKREMLDEARTLELLSKIDSSNTTTITRIKLSNKSFGNEAVAVLAPKLASLINLQVADLSDIIAGRETSIGLNVLSTISEALSQSPHLVEVDLSENALGPRGVAACRPLLSSVESLKRLTFNNDGLSAEAMNEIRDLLLFRGPDTPTVLDKLHFWNNMSGDGGGTAIASVVELSPLLSDFRLSSTRCGSEGGANILKALGARCTLRHVDLSDNTFGGAAAPLLRSLVSNNLQLITLNLSDLSLENEAVATVLECLSVGVARPEMTFLDLSFNGVVDGHEVLKHFPAMVSNCPQLKTFGFEENEIGSRGALRISRGMSNSKALVNMNLKMCDIRDMGALAIARAYVGRSSGMLEMNGNMLSESVVQEMGNLLLDNNDLGSFSDNDEDGAEDEEEEGEEWASDIAEESTGNGKNNQGVDELSSQISEMKV